VQDGFAFIGGPSPNQPFESDPTTVGSEEDFLEHLRQSGQKPGCWTGVFVDSALSATDFLPSLPGGSDFGDAAKAGAAAVATNYTMTQGLTVPLRSSIVRDILAAGEDASVAIPLAIALYSVSVGLVHEVGAIRAGTCKGF
jgi:hypothetical protein